MAQNGVIITTDNYEGLPKGEWEGKLVQIIIEGQQYILFREQPVMHLEILKHILLKEDIEINYDESTGRSRPVLKGEDYEVNGMGLAKNNLDSNCLEVYHDMGSGDYKLYPHQASLKDIRGIVLKSFWE